MKYVGGGYWRDDSVPRGEKAEILHGEEALEAERARIIGWLEQHRYVWWPRAELVKTLRSRPWVKGGR